MLKQRPTQNYHVRIRQHRFGNCHPIHPSLSQVQSPDLPQTTDYAIIGSGVTGCSVSKALLEHETPLSSKASTVTVFEARTLTSGATGRNGGLLTSFVPDEYKSLSEAFGHEQAVKIVRSANRTLEKMHALGNSSKEMQDASEVRKLLDVICYQDDATFQEAVESHRLYEKHVPEERQKAQVLSAEEARR